MNPVNARRFQYCVCVQNRHNGHWGGADQEHHHAFLVGRISAVVPSPERPDRYLVEFSEYAKVDSPDAWPGLRNPVRYGTLEEFGVTDPDGHRGVRCLRYRLERTPIKLRTKTKTAPVR